MESVFMTRYARLASLNASELAKSPHLGPGCYKSKSNGMICKDPSRCSPFNKSPNRPALFQNEDPDLRYRDEAGSESSDESDQVWDEDDVARFEGDEAFADLAKDVQRFAPEKGKRKATKKLKRRRRRVEIDAAKMQRRQDRQLEKNIKGEWIKYMERLEVQTNEDFREIVGNKVVASPVVATPTRNARPMKNLKGSVEHSSSLGFSASSGRFIGKQMVGRVLESGDSPCVAYQLDMKSWTEFGSPMSTTVRNSDDWNLLKCEGADAIYDLEDYWGKALGNPEDSTHFFGSDHGRFPDCLMGKDSSFLSENFSPEKHISKRRQRLMKRAAFNTVKEDVCVDVLGNRQVQTKQRTGFGTMAPRFKKPTISCTASVQLSPQFNINKSGWESGVSIPRGQYRKTEAGQTRVRPILIDHNQMNNYLQSQNSLSDLASLKITSSIESDMRSSKSSSHLTMLENDPFEWMYDRADGGEAAIQCAGRLRQILMYNSNPEIVKQQEKEKQEKLAEKEKNIQPLHTPKSLNPIIQKKADTLKSMAESKKAKLPSEQNQMRLTIKLMTGIGIEVKCSKNGTVRDVKELIRRKRSYDPSSQVLVFEGRELDDDVPLRDYGIKNHSTLRCVV